MGGEGVGEGACWSEVQLMEEVGHLTPLAILRRKSHESFA